MSCVHGLLNFEIIRHAWVVSWHPNQGPDILCGFCSFVSQCSWKFDSLTHLARYLAVPTAAIERHEDVVGTLNVYR